jgi:hypothetical protein
VRRAHIAFAVVFITAIASADAPSDQYDSFSPQASDITDHYARLDWQRIIAPSMVPYPQAITACPFPQRLPTFRELLTLVDENPHDEWDQSSGTTSLRYIDKNAFPATPAGPFWSMSPGITKTAQTIKVVDFLDGQSKDSDDIMLPATVGWVRCVTDLVP